MTTDILTRCRNFLNVLKKHGLSPWMHSPRAIGTERGCVEDQPQRVGSSKASRACSVLRLVEDDTAALRSPGTPGIGAVLCRCVLPATCYTGVFRTGRLRLSTFEQDGRDSERAVEAM